MKKATSLRLYSGNGVDLLSHACQYLCSLKSLYISDSHLESLRFLGAHFSKVKELTLADCRLRSLDGITSFPNLKILRLPGNEIHNVDQCIYLPQLCHLDVRSYMPKDRVVTTLASGGLQNVKLAIVGTCLGTWRLVRFREFLHPTGITFGYCLVVYCEFEV
ncbi:uncharacterized protein TNCT_165421 [Trichonephila clavata]|uniref:Uncharacterized protein n=1 Tax=Trichonephila clavata TaxID=2740835 RepID=A0A8X6LZT0_TRICU|nr:uncharacterized protein TNCT_165421 [Trichonephila clavata]